LSLVPFDSKAHYPGIVQSERAEASMFWPVDGHEQLTTR
jgi:hypothetical protein